MSELLTEWPWNSGVRVMLSLAVQKGQQSPWVVWDTALSWGDPGLRTLREVAGITASWSALIIPACAAS